MYSSFELSFFILNTEKGYEYILSPMMGSENKWKSFGRFDYLFNNSLIKKDKSGNDLSKKVEITFYPKEAHNSNVCICNHNKNAFLEFNTRNTTSIEESIPINDIYMFIDENDKIIFLQKSTRQILSFETTNKYITTLFPPMLKVLMDVCKNQNNSLESFLVQILNLSKKLKGHTPEIRYKNFVILPETWRINKDDLFKNNNFVSFKYFDKYVDKLIFANLLPEVIYTGELDRKLILNLNYLIDKKILYDMLKKDSSLLIYKNIFSSNELLLTDKNCEKYIGEFVFQFENDFIYDKSLDYLRKRISFLDYENQYEHSSFAFDNWTTILLYVEKQDENRILINQIYEMYTYFKRKNIIINFFFIRYKDPCSHLRLRFKVNKEHKNDFISNIHDFVSTLKKYKILNDVKYVTYIPEINRYGGNNSIEKAEELFEYNSLQVLEILKLIQNKKTKLNINQIFLMLSYKIIRDMNISDSEIIEYLQGYKFSKKINSNLLKEIEDYFYNNFNLKSFERKNEQMLYKIFNSSTSINYEYWKTICNEYDNDKIKESYIKKHCIISILHMLHNRLIGIDSENETLLMGLLEKMIYTKKQREKYYISK